MWLISQNGLSGPDKIKAFKQNYLVGHLHWTENDSCECVKRFKNKNR